MSHIKYKICIFKKQMSFWCAPKFGGQTTSAFGAFSNSRSEKAKGNSPKKGFQHHVAEEISLGTAGELLDYFSIHFHVQMFMYKFYEKL